MTFSISVPAIMRTILALSALRSLNSRAEERIAPLHTDHEKALREIILGIFTELSNRLGSAATGTNLDEFDVECDVFLSIEIAVPTGVVSSLIRTGIEQAIAHAAYHRARGEHEIAEETLTAATEHVLGALRQWSDKGVAGTPPGSARIIASYY